MSSDRDGRHPPERGEDGQPQDPKPVWKVDRDESIARAAERPDHEATGKPGAGKLVYIDEYGQRRHLPADLSRLSTDERDAAIGALSAALGADPDYATIAALERLAEMHASGAISEEIYLREKRRLESRS